MARIKPQTLLLQSKKKKGPSRVSVPTIIVYCLLLGVLVLLLVATYRHWSKRFVIYVMCFLCGFIVMGVDVSLVSKKYDLPGYATLNTPKGYITAEPFKDGAPEIVDKFLDLCQKGHFKGMPFHRVIKHYVIQGGDSEGLGAAEDWISKEKLHTKLMTRMQASEQVSIDISRADEELVRGLKEKMENISSSITICRVPEELHKGKTRDYYPDLVAVGPYHRGKPNLKDMEKHKWRYLFALLNRKPNLEANLSECTKALRELEHRARRCYAGDIGLTSDEFVELMLVDCGFIIELLIKCAHKSLRRRGDPLFCTPGKLFDLRLDMILLENQIPLFVLQRLFQVSPIPKQCTMSLSELAFRFFKSMVPGGEQHDLQAKLNEEAHHLLDLVHNCLLPSTFPREPSKQLQIQVPIKCATDLRTSGIKLRKASSRNLLDAKFIHGILRIPSLNIDQCTERLFRNLVALEQCGCVNTPCITSYVFLIHGLINSDKDEKLLVDRQIITNSLDSEAKAHTLFNDLCKDTTFQESYYEGLRDQVHEYIERQVSVRQRRGVSSRRQEETLPKNAPRVGYRVLVAVALLTLTMTSVGTLISALAFFLHRN